MRSISIEEKIHEVALQLARENSMTLEQVFAKAILDMKKKGNKNTPPQEEFSMSKQIDEWMERADAKLPDTLQAMLAAGVPISYRDDKGRLVKEMPDGDIMIIKED